jgi:hypothetical protein
MYVLCSLACRRWSDAMRAAHSPLCYVAFRLMYVQFVNMCYRSCIPVMRNCRLPPTPCLPPRMLGITEAAAVSGVLIW